MQHDSKWKALHVAALPHFMREERGLSEATIRNRCWHVEKLLVWFMRRNRSLAEVSFCDV